MKRKYRAWQKDSEKVRSQLHALLHMLQELQKAELPLDSPEWNQIATKWDKIAEGKTGMIQQFFETKIKSGIWTKENWPKGVPWLNVPGLRHHEAHEKAEKAEAKTAKVKAAKEVRATQVQAAQLQTAPDNAAKAQSDVPAFVRVIRRRLLPTTSTTPASMTTASTALASNKSKARAVSPPIVTCPRAKCSKFTTEVRPSSTAPAEATTEDTTGAIVEDSAEIATGTAADIPPKASVDTPTDSSPISRRTRARTAAITKSVRAAQQKKVNALLSRSRANLLSVSVEEWEEATADTDILKKNEDVAKRLLFAHRVQNGDIDLELSQQELEALFEGRSVGRRGRFWARKGRR